MNMIRPQQIFRYYYLSIPVFFIVELVVASRIRLSLPDNLQEYYVIYYLLSFVLGGFVFIKPKSAVVFGILESAIAFYFLIASVMLPAMGISYNSGMQAYSFGVNHLINFLVVGGILIMGLRSLINSLGHDLH